MLLKLGIIILRVLDLEDKGSLQIHWGHHNFYSFWESCTCISSPDQYSKVRFLCPHDWRSGGHIVFVLSVIPSFCPPLWNFNLANNFWTVSARALIFHMNISCDKTFPWVPLFFTLWFDLGVWPIFWNL